MKQFFSPLPIMQPAGIGIIRIVVGLLLVYHGWEVFDKEIMKGYAGWDAFKGFSSPLAMAYFGKASELVAGILLTIGLFTRVACIIIMGTFIYITFLVGNGKFWYEDQHPFMFLLIAFVFFFTGPGIFSADVMLNKQARRNTIKEMVS
ncbi:MAG: DoxX family protein [Bacteroidota bacterium]